MKSKVLARATKRKQPANDISRHVAQPEYHARPAHGLTDFGNGYFAISSTLEDGQVQVDFYLQEEESVKPFKVGSLVVGGAE